MTCQCPVLPWATCRLRSQASAASQKPRWPSWSGFGTTKMRRTHRHRRHSGRHANPPRPRYPPRPRHRHPPRSRYARPRRHHVIPPPTCHRHHRCHRPPTRCLATPATRQLRRQTATPCIPSSPPSPISPAPSIPPSPPSPSGPSHGASTRIEQRLPCPRMWHHTPDTTCPRQFPRSLPPRRMACLPVSRWQCVITRTRIGDGRTGSLHSRPSSVTASCD